MQRGERVYADGELIVTHEVVDDTAQLCIVPALGFQRFVITSEARLDREHVEKLRDTLTYWLKATK